MRSFNQKWVELLTEGREDKQKEFEVVLSNSKCEALAIMDYRRLQMQEGRGQHITSKHLIFGNIASVEELQSYLQELFLEPIRTSDVEYFYQSATKRGYKSLNEAVEELYQRHLKDTGKRFLSIVLTI